MIPRSQISVRLKKELIAWYTEEADRLGMSRIQLMALVLETHRDHSPWTVRFEQKTAQQETYEAHEQKLLADLAATSARLDTEGPAPQIA